MLSVAQALELAVKHHRAGDLEPAERIYRAVLRIDPRHAGVRYNLGNVLQKKNLLDDAIDQYQAALSMTPDDSTAHRVLGTAYKAQGNLGKAIACFRKALELRPDYAEAHNNLGNSYLDLQEPEASVECFRRAVCCRPDSADFLFNLGNALYRCGRLEEAERELRCAVRLRPDDPELHNSLGIALFDQANCAEALACYERALALDSGHARSHYNRALAWLWQGDWKRGWSEYEWRHRLFGRCTAAEQAAWRGERSPDATLLIEAEQGLGDIIQFARFVVEARKRVGRVLMCAPSSMHAILRRIGGMDELVADDAPIAAHDFRISLMSLPYVLGITPEYVPSEPYLRADVTRCRFWQNALAAVRGLRIGIQWQGNPAHAKDRWRSIPLAEFAPIARLPGVSLISLQKGPGVEQIRGAEFKLFDIGTLLDESSGAFEETAAIIENLDVVITADTSIAHLAGALGANTWILLSNVPEWRWMQDGCDTPWYRGARIFRQPSRGNWNSVIHKVCEALIHLQARNDYSHSKESS